MYRYDHNVEPYMQVQQYLRRQQFERMRHGCNAQGWLLVAYLGIMSGSIMLVGFLNGFVQTVRSVAEYGRADVSVSTEEIIYYSGWGYILAGVIGFVLLLLWKKPAYISGTIFKRNRTMKPLRFVQILSLFMTVQLLHLLLGALVESVLKQFGVIFEGDTGYSADGWSMFIYSAVAAPVTEEILFRGVLLRSFEPYGKRFAIVTSALLFGLFHGNLSQGLFAFSAGLVLAYVALEYHILWAVVLHMFNNMMIADTLSRLTQWLAPEWERPVLLAVLGVFGLIAMVTLGLKWQRIAAFFKKERNEPDCYKAFRSAAGIIVLVVLCVLTILESLLTSITLI